MSSATFVGVVPALYYVSFAALGGLVYLILAHRRRRQNGHWRVDRAFLALASALLCWQLTLFLEVRVRLPVAQLWVGRFNFAVVALAVYLAYRFVVRVQAAARSRAPTLGVVYAVETGAIVAITMLTPLVDAQEIPANGRAVTVYGPLYPVYLLHVLYYLVLSLRRAFRERRRAATESVAAQFSLIGGGILVTGSVGLVTNAILPYGFGNFDLCDVGSLSVLWFVLAVAYATLVKGLFDLTFLVRETLVYGALLAFVLGAYSSGVFVATQYLTGSSDKATQFLVLLIAFSFDPLRRFLEKKVDRLLFGDAGADSSSRSTVEIADGGRFRSARLLTILFPWRRP
ncbi:MAG: hypothetical protein KGJ62_01550 [Armatimonadetes bacterium]|nr:hypothetical protein [Armatimonadota bacterium]MDE2205465.1 hypothetical protein [Armatimonadota bacterium]